MVSRVCTSLAVLAAMLALPRPVLAVELRDALDCPNETQLRAALTQNAPAISGELGLTRTGAGELAVSWHTGGRSFSRNIELASHDCLAAAQTVALLVAAWNRSLPTAAAPDPLTQAAQIKSPQIRPAPSNPPTEPAPTPSPPVASTTPPIPNAPLDAGSEILPSAIHTQGAPPSPDAGPIKIATAPEVPVIHIVEPEPAPTPLETTPWHLGGALEARGALGLGTSRDFGSGAAAIELGRGERFAGQLTLALDTRQLADSSLGSVVADRQTLALQALARFHPMNAHPAGAIRLEAGALLERLTGHSTIESATALRPGIALGAAYEERFGPAALSIGPEFEILAERTTFSFDQGTVLSLPWAWAGLSAEIRTQFF